MYPKLILDYNKLVHNTKILVEKCHQNGISVMAISKVFSAWDEGVDAYVVGGADFIGDSRVQNLKSIKHNIPKVLLRIPMQSEVNEVVKYCDISLNSSLATIKLLNEAAKVNNTVHKIILMVDIGDLREGIFYNDNYLELVEDVLNLSNIELYGVGTNLTCYGAVIPTKNTLKKLEEVCRNVESTFGITLQLKSFGNSSSIYLLSTEDDYSYFNNLRLGEAIVFGRETAYGQDLENMYNNVFTFEAEIVELYEKPSIPEGDIGVNAFGEKVVFKDKGVMKRAILAFGKQDVNYNDLIIIDKRINIIGGSSDHTIIEILEGNYAVGDKIKFNLSYGGLLALSTSKYVYKEVVYGIDN